MVRWNWWRARIGSGARADAIKTQSIPTAQYKPETLRSELFPDEQHTTGSAFSDLPLTSAWQVRNLESTPETASDASPLALLRNARIKDYVAPLPKCLPPMSLPPARHAERLLEWLQKHEMYGVYLFPEMLSLYHGMCLQQNLAVRPWAPVAHQLAKITSHGKKTFCWIFVETEQQKRRRRVYVIAPPPTPKRHIPAKNVETESPQPESTPNDRQVA